MELELDPGQLGTIDIEADVWVPYVDMHDAQIVPTRLKLGERDYAWDSSFLVKGFGATMPAKIHELRAAGRQPLVVERGDRYYVFVAAA